MNGLVVFEVVDCIPIYAIDSIGMRIGGCVVSNGFYAWFCSDHFFDCCYFFGESGGISNRLANCIEGCFVVLKFGVSRVAFGNGGIAFGNGGVAFGGSGVALGNGGIAFGFGLRQTLP